MYRLVDIRYSMPPESFPYVLERYGYRVEGRTERERILALDTLRWLWMQEPAESGEVFFYDNVSEVLEKMEYLSVLIPELPLRIRVWTIGETCVNNSATLAMEADRRVGTRMEDIALAAVRRGIAAYRRGQLSEEVDWLREGF